MSHQDDRYRDDAPPPEQDGHDDRYRDDAERHDRQSTNTRQPQQSGGCSKGCIWGLVGCGIFAILAMIAGGVGMWWFVTFMQKGMSTDPTVIRAATQEMADINPPARFEPKFKMNAIFAKVIFYTTADADSMLMLIEIDKQMALKGEKQNQDFGKGFRRGFGDGGQGVKERELKIKKTEVVDMTIRGKATKVSISEGQDAEGKDYRVIETGFEGKVGHVELLMQMPEKKYDADEIKKFLESIK